MTEIYYNFDSPAIITLTIFQGTTYYNRWQLRYKTTNDPFPFFDTDNVTPLWTARAYFRKLYSSASPLITLTSGSNEVFFTIDTSVSPYITHYGLLISATKTSLLTPSRVYYDIEFIRVSDSYVIRIQQGPAVISYEVTK